MEAKRSPGVGATSESEQDTGARNHAWVFWEKSKHS